MEALVRLRERDTGGDLPGMLRRVDRVLKGEGSARGMADKVSKPEDIQGGDRGRDQGRGGMG
jgi:hypothetical protein